MAVHEVNPLREELECIGKMRFATKTDAQRHLGHHAKNKPPARHRGRGRMQAYRCSFCGEWHVGHERKRKRPR